MTRRIAAVLALVAMLAGIGGHAAAAGATTPAAACDPVLYICV
ncbi:MAG: hypothetical protein ACRD0O_10015 [Acidimicrobiia bacterium]